MKIIDFIPKNYSWATIRNNPRTEGLGSVDLEKLTVTDIRATVSRLRDWRWQYLIFNSPFFGIEPSRDLAKTTVEKIIKEYMHDQINID